LAVVCMVMIKMQGIGLCVLYSTVHCLPALLQYVSSNLGLRTGHAMCT